MSRSSASLRPSFNSPSSTVTSPRESAIGADRPCLSTILAPNSPVLAPISCRSRVPAGSSENENSETGGCDGLDGGGCMAGSWRTEAGGGSQGACLHGLPERWSPQGSQPGDGDRLQDVPENWRHARLGGFGTLPAGRNPHFADRQYSRNPATWCAGLRVAIRRHGHPRLPRSYLGQPTGSGPAPAGTRAGA